jgi:hypothetical protein
MRCWLQGYRIAVTHRLAHSHYIRYLYKNDDDVRHRIRWVSENIKTHCYIYAYKLYSILMELIQFIYMNTYTIIIDLTTPCSEFLRITKVTVTYTCTNYTVYWCDTYILLIYIYIYTINIHIYIYIYLTTPCSWKAQKLFPARPNPVCTSSAIHTPPMYVYYLFVLIPIVKFLEKYAVLIKPFE